MRVAVVVVILTRQDGDVNVLPVASLHGKGRIFTVSG